MIFYYAMGGGLGHLTRAFAVAHTLQLHDVLLLTNSSFAAQLPHLLPVLHPPPALEHNRRAYQDWFIDQCVQKQPQAIYVDAFPAGIQGELTSVMYETHWIYLARYLRWQRYHQLLPLNPPFYDYTWLLEPLDSQHQQWITNHSRAVAPLHLHDPPAQLDPSIIHFLTQLQATQQPIWMIVHAGSTAEIAELCAYAEAKAAIEQVQPQFVLLTPEPVPAQLARMQYHHLSIYPAAPAFTFADQIISAVGFNIARQTAPFRSLHAFLPFERTYDDQWIRAARLRLQHLNS